MASLEVSGRLQRSCLTPSARRSGRLPEQVLQLCHIAPQALCGRHSLSSDRLL